MNGTCPLALLSRFSTHSSLLKREFAYLSKGVGGPQSIPHFLNILRVTSHYFVSCCDPSYLLLSCWLPPDLLSSHSQQFYSIRCWLWWLTWLLNEVQLSAAPLCGLCPKSFSGSLGSFIVQLFILYSPKNANAKQPWDCSPADLE